MRDLGYWRSSAYSLWSQSSKELLDQLSLDLPHESAAIGICHLSNPQPDEWLLLEQFEPTDLGKLLQALDQREDTSAPATLSWSPQSRPHEGAAPYGLIVVLPECLYSTCYWCLILARSEAPFTDAQTAVAWLSLREWQNDLFAPPESGLSRVILGHDQRVIAADQKFLRQKLLRDNMAEKFIDALMPVIEQRYPNLSNDQTEEAVLEFDKDTLWVQFTRHNTSIQPSAAQWRLEIRPTDETDLPPVGQVKDDRIGLAIAYLHEHFANSPNLAEVARSVHMSPFHFHRLFSKQVGVSPKQYLQRKQLQQAKWLLRASRTPISQIAKQTGFSSHGHFTSTFHRVVGKSPTDYREAFS